MKTTLVTNNVGTMPLPPGAQDPVVAADPSATGSAWSPGTAQSETPVATSTPAPGLGLEVGGAQRIGLCTDACVDPNILVGEDDFGECVSSIHFHCSISNVKTCMGHNC